MNALEGEILEPETQFGESDKGANEASVRAGFWRTFKKAARQIPFAEDLVAAYYCALDPQTPGKSRAVLFGALAYFIMPMDAIPDFLALVGFSDDIAVLTLAIATIRSNMTDAHRAAARKALAEMDEDAQTG
ncbi:YkvA family protein [Hoeflea sp. G2-23]|uniref:YkvA family protein n=1 Tax=Hoeflea algicola TaxID=2983763 RepID=A0ABT3ZAZ4_9HYPH|nr:YkvA family protein [Hoeflea algicola]MCY0148965.1 YkvA family protein [Hoeflea algicola]